MLINYRRCIRHFVSLTTHAEREASDQIPTIHQADCAVSKMSPAERNTRSSVLICTAATCFERMSIVQQACVQWSYRGYITHHITVWKVSKRRQWRPVSVTRNIVTIITWFTRCSEGVAQRTFHTSDRSKALLHLVNDAGVPNSHWRRYE